MPGKPLVAIIMGSDSDLPIMKEASKLLNDFGVRFEVKVLSAHRTPELARKFAMNAKRDGFQVIIAGAGGAAHLAGVLASHTTLPVIGVPIETKYLKGIDSLFSTVQMPGGVPVSCMSIGKSGAKNAGISALQILALRDIKIHRKLDLFRKDMVKVIKKKNKNLNLRVG
ncbi:MAG: 5-(carboxyamino)imidazole ribonucleotide mutase [Candidatus Omnitrophica bacterium]|nr:5-(carboxyamino)imidazole ribonucleotide mutase [Candidatus Omnitrophota bacterium]